MITSDPHYMQYGEARQLILAEIQKMQYGDIRVLSARHKAKYFYALLRRQGFKGSIQRHPQGWQVRKLGNIKRVE